MAERSRQLTARGARRRAAQLVRGALRGEGGPLAAAILDLYKDVPRRSWLVRAVTRFILGTVERRSKTVYVVKGVPELGDWHGEYIVQRVGERRYTCTCFSSAYGYVRRARICTHIAAVILYRRWRRIKHELEQQDGQRGGSQR